MKFFGRKRKRESDEEEKELVLDTEAEEQAPDQDDSDAKVKAEGDAPLEEKASAPGGDLLTEIGAEADSEIEAEETALGGEGGPSQADDSLDAGLLDIFRDAKEEVGETTLASELEDVPVQDLLNDLLGLRHHLGVGPQARAETGEDSK